MNYHIHFSTIGEKLMIQVFWLGYDPLRAWARAESQKWLASLKQKTRELHDREN